MKKKLILILTCCIFLISKNYVRSQCATNCTLYTGASIPIALQPNAGNSVFLSDDQLSTAVPIGFTFTYMCTPYTNAYISSNGFISFNGAVGSGCCSGQICPTVGGNPNNYVALAWNDLFPPGGGTIKYQTIGVAPNRVFVVTYSLIPFCCTTSPPFVSGQIMLYETTNVIEVHNASVGNQGSNQTQGIMNLTGTIGYPVPGRNSVPWTSTGTAYQWTPALQNTVCAGTPTAGITVATTTTGCNSYTTNLSLLGAVAGCGLTYQWQSAPAIGGPYTNIPGATTITAVVSNTTNTFYQCVLSCSGTTVASTPVNCLFIPTPTLTIVPSNTVVCSGSTVSLIGGGATTYTWLPGNQNASSITVSPIVATTYTLQGSNSGCNSTQTVLINVVNTPVYTLSALTTTICQGGSFSTSVSISNSSSYSYNWSGGLGIVSPTNSVTLIIPPAISGSISSVIYSVVVTPTLLNCPVLQTLTATIYNPPTPTITPINPVCNTNPTLTLLASPGGGTWTTNAAISASGILNPALATIGTSTVLYSVGIGSCIASGITNISVSQFNTAFLPSTINPQCTTMPLVNLNAIVQSTVGGVWTGPNVSGTYSFNPAGLVTGVYTLTYNTSSTPIATLCPDSRTISVNVINPITPTITQVGPFCNTSSTIALTVAPNVGVWSVTGYLSSSGIFNPALSSIGQNTVQYTIGSNTCNAQQTKTINVEAFVPATIIGSISDKCISSSPVSLLPLTTNILGTWSGSGIAGSNFDPALSGTGNFTLNYNTASIPSGLCPDNASISVKVFSLAPASITRVGPFCSSNPPVQLQANVLGGSFGMPNNNFAISNSGLFSPSLANIGDNIINYSTTAGPCLAIGTTTINVEKYISANFISLAGPFCKNSLPVNLYSITQNPSGIWIGPATVNGVFTPSNASIGNNNIIIYQTNSMPTASLCPDTSAIRISINDIPNVSVKSNISNGCVPIEVTFSAPTANNGTGIWNFGDGFSETGLFASHIYNAPGTYSVTFNYQDDIGCSTEAKLFNTIDVYAVPYAGFVFDPQDEITVANSEVQFTNLSTVLGNNTYQWQIGNLYQLSDVNPKVVFPKAGDYIITLTATTKDGCKNQESKVVSVKNDYGVYIPSSFSPNFDDLNDVFNPVFSPYGLDLKTGYEFEVFDRWGHSLFQTNDASKGWDGIINSKGSTEQKQEVYVYKLRYKDLDGKTYSKIGHVSLIK